MAVAHTEGVQAGCAGLSSDEEASSLSAEANKAIVRRFYEEVWSKGDISAIDELFAIDFVNHDPGPHSADREGFKEYVNWARSASDYRPTIDDLIAEGDKVVVRLTGRGRLKRKFMGITLTDKQFTQSGIVIWRLADGKIVERWARWG